MAVGIKVDGNKVSFEIRALALSTGCFCEDGTPASSGIKIPSSILQIQVNLSPMLSFFSVGEELVAKVCA